MAFERHGASATDPRTGYAISMDIIHANTHAGIMFIVDLVDVALVDTGVLEMLIVVPADVHPHARFKFATNGDSRIQIFEGPTYSATGSSITPINRNRNSSNTMSILFYSGPTITGDGTTLHSTIIAGGSGGKAGSGSTTEFDEWNFIPGEDYLIRLTNISGQTKAVAIEVDIYEGEQVP